MTDIIRFYKKDGKWYADVPNHTLEECEMVYGTDIFFNLHTNENDTELIVEFSDEDSSLSNEGHLDLIGDYGEDGGALYKVFDPSVVKPYELSLCKVVFDFFGKFPSTIYILNIYNSVNSALINQSKELSPYGRRISELRRNIEHLRCMVDFPQINELEGNYFILNDSLTIRGGRFVKKEKNKYHYILFYKGFRYEKGYDFAIQKNSCFFIEYEDILEGKIDLKIVTKEEYQAAFDEYFNSVKELIINDSDEFEDNE